MVYFGSQFRSRSTVEGKSQRQEREAAGHTVSPVRKGREMNVADHFLLFCAFWYPSLGMVPISVKCLGVASQMLPGVFP